jgi:hypothetical protein
MKIQSRKFKKSRKHKSRKYKNRRKSHKRRITMKGGNYERDVTTRTTEGVATKPLNKFVVTVPGRGTMSAAAYIRLMEDIDRNGNDYYD